MKKFTLAIALLALTTAGYSQESQGGTPESFSKTVECIAPVPFVTLPAVDTDQLLLEDSLNAGKKMPWRFGFNQYQNINPNNAGVWSKLKNGGKIWRTGIKCPDALSVNITFDKYIIPEGAKLYVYSADKSYILGAFTSKNVQEDGAFGVDLVPGSEIIVEYYEPANVAFAGELNIYRITHGYRDLVKYAIKSFGDAGNCHNNVVCPEGTPWANQIRSVAVIVVGGGEACTGALVNNTANNGTPYFLTANHCGTTGVNTWVFRFNWNSPTCTPSSNGPTNNTVSGSTLKATRAASDFTLLQLNSNPPSNYNVYYSGWNRSNIPPTSGVGIHHPSGDVKKISFITQVFDSIAWSGNTENHWFVQWSDGVTEPGSSGSPLFDQNKRIVGQLHGGASYCGASIVDLNDEYGKFYYSWDQGSSSSSRLKEWLDPNSTAPIAIDGYDPNIGGLPPLDVQAVSLTLPTDQCSASFVPVLTAKNVGQNTIISMSITYVLDGGSPQIQTWNGSLTTNQTVAINMPQIAYGAGPHTYTATITLVNAQADPLPNNNAQTGSFSSAGAGNSYALTFSTDNYGNESGFYILDMLNDTVFAVDTSSLGNNIVDTTLTFCLPNGCYKFLAVDLFGDGMCCAYGNGEYLLTNQNNVTMAAGAEFGSLETTYFCTTIPNDNSALLDVIVPEGLYCNNAISPQVKISNQGQNALQQLAIHYQVDGGAVQTYNWSGNLAHFASTTVNLSTTSVSPGNHTFTVYTDSPNNNTDAIVQNDTLTSTFTYIPGTKVDFNLTTDLYPQEISWEIRNSNNVIVYQSPDPTGLAGAVTYNIPYCLPDGCYTFYIYDSEGDGICCGQNGDGSYSIVLDGTTIATGAQYTTADTVNFCINVGVEENNVGTINVYPNPASGKVYIALEKVQDKQVTVDIINAQGQVVSSQKITTSLLNAIDVSGYATGLYLIRVSGNKSVLFSKPVIIKN